MARIPYIPEDTPEPAELVDAIRKRRGGRLNEVDRMLLHAPPIAAAWNQLFLAIRTNITLPPKYREMAVCGVAILHGNHFEVDVHAPIYLQAGGTQKQLAALRLFEEASRDATLFDAVERVVMRMTIEITKTSKMTDATFAELQSLIPDNRQVVELVTVVASYNMAARLIGALQIG